MKTKDYFEGMSDADIYTANIMIEEKIHNTIPKYYGGDFYKFNGNDIIKEIILKQKFNEIGMFCFVAWEWIKPLAEWIGDRKCLEVMAGRG